MRLLAVTTVACLLVAVPAQAEDDPPTTNPCLGPHVEDEVDTRRRIAIGVGAGGVGQDGDPFTCNFVHITTPSFPGFACVQPGGPYQVFTVGPVTWYTYCGGATGSAVPPCWGFFYAQDRQEVDENLWVEWGTNLQPDCIHLTMRAGTMTCAFDSNVPTKTHCWRVR